MGVLDTSFLIDLERGMDAARNALDAMVADGEPLLLPAIVASEYIAGRREDERLTTWHALDGSYTVVFPEAKHVIEAARLAWTAQRSGQMPGWSDAQIAAVAMFEGTYVVTGDVRHFQALGCGWWDYRTDDAPSPAS